MQIKCRFREMMVHLLDIFYFKGKMRNPRWALVGYIPRRPIKVVEFCAGSAANSLLIAKNRPNAQVTAIDISQQMLDIAAKRAQKEHLPNFKTEQMNAKETRYADDSFDEVIISLVLHRISSNEMCAIINEAKRILKPGGNLLVLEWEKPKQWIKRLLFLFILCLAPRSFSRFLQLDLEQFFTEMGFRTEYIRHCDYTQVFKAVLCEECQAVPDFN